jgi:hypothetical protein
MVHKIEGLGTELQLSFFVQRKTLKEGEVPVVDARTNDGVASGCTPAERRCRGKSAVLKKWSIVRSSISFGLPI